MATRLRLPPQPTTTPPPPPPRTPGTPMAPPWRTPRPATTPGPCRPNPAASPSWSVGSSSLSAVMLHCSSGVHYRLSATEWSSVFRPKWILQPDFQQWMERWPPYSGSNLSNLLVILSSKYLNLRLEPSSSTTPSSMLSSQILADQLKMWDFSASCQNIR